MAEQPDYDMAGYVAKYGKPDQSKGQHLTDEFKLPNLKRYFKQVERDSVLNMPE